MERAIQAMHRAQNALLESPTGTGKTACLLCSTLAFQSAKAQKNMSTPTVVYASRTHGQLAQVVRELKKTSYRPRMCVLGSRQQSCVLPAVYRDAASNIDAACRSYVARRACPHYRYVENYAKRDKSFEQGTPRDIEELVSLAQQSGGKQLKTDAGPGPCPYYLAREHARRAQLVLLPYSYIVDPKLRKSVGEIDFSNSVLVFDEAHNLEAAASDAASSDISLDMLMKASSEAQSCAEIMAEVEQSGEIAAGDDPRTRRSAEDFRTLKGTINALWDAISNVQLSQSAQSNVWSMTKNASFIYELLEEVGITEDTEMMYSAMLEDADSLFSSEQKVRQQSEAGAPSPTGESVRVQPQRGGRGEGSSSQRGLSQLRNQIAAIFDAKREGVEFAYKVHITTEGSNTTHRKLGFWCFVPGVHLCRFVRTAGVRSIILASGTLSPMDSFASELMLDFPVRLENTHVIGARQVWAGVLSTGPGNQRLDSSYNLRATDEYKQELGRTIFNLAKTIPQGLLVFFPSYAVLEACATRWKELQMSPNGYKSVWERIEEYKAIVMEPKDSGQFNASQLEFRNHVDRPNSSGAIFLAVCRGKASEGLDFSDSAGRAAVVTGIPFALKTDPKVMIKRQFLNERSQSNNSCINGDEWYVQSAMRAVNQALGRIIRHRDDFGAVILADRRFSGQREHNQLSRWLRGYVKRCDTFGTALREINSFFSSPGRTEVPARAQHESHHEQHQAQSQHGMFETPEAKAADDAGTNVASVVQGSTGSNTSLSAEEHSSGKRTLAARLRGAKRMCKDAAPHDKEHEHQTKSSKNQNYGDGNDLQRAIERCLEARGQLPEVKLNLHPKGSEPTAQQFMEYVKRALSQQQLNDFQAVLKGFKSGTVSFHMVLEVATALFGEQTGLIRAFGAFVPPSHRSLFEQRIQSSNISEVERCQIAKEHDDEEEEERRQQQKSSDNNIEKGKFQSK